jgi:uncharacterized protein (TIGR02588 family)
VTFGVASALLLVVVAAITSLWLGGTERPPQFSVRTLPVRESAGGFHVRAVVSNTGDETAEGVQVVAELTMGDEPPLEGEQMIDFLSGDDEEEVEFIFTADPADGDLEVGVRSFKVP